MAYHNNLWIGCLGVYGTVCSILNITTWHITTTYGLICRTNIASSVAHRSSSDDRLEMPQVHLEQLRPTRQILIRFNGTRGEKIESWKQYMKFDDDIILSPCNNIKSTLRGRGRHLHTISWRSRGTLERHGFIVRCQLCGKSTPGPVNRRQHKIVPVSHGTIDSGRRK